MAGTGEQVSFEELYRELILDHYKAPRNRGALAGADYAVELFNPLCGDQITVAVKLEGDTIADCRFDGHGCAISQASASMMTERMKGRGRAEALAAIGRFKAAMRGEVPFGELAGELGDAVALEGVRKFPVRIKCATLAWNSLEQALQGRSGKAEVTGEES